MHPASFRTRVEEHAPATGLAQFDADTFMGPSSLEAARRATGAAVAAVDALYDGEARNAFIAARPARASCGTGAGHGVLLFQPCGNRRATCALARRRPHSCCRFRRASRQRNGGRVLGMMKTHFSHRLMNGRNIRVPGGPQIAAHMIISHNAPLATGVDGDAFRRAWGENLLPALSDFGPDFIVISAGFGRSPGRSAWRLEVVGRRFCVGNPRNRWTCGASMRRPSGVGNGGRL